MSAGAIGFVSIPKSSAHAEYTAELVRYDQFVKTCNRKYIGTNLGKDNVINLLGDLRFAMQEIMNAYDIDEQTVLQRSALKRYDEYFDQKK